MGRLDGKRAVITGGSNGIGRAIAEAFAREGADVFFTIRDDETAAREVVHYADQFGHKIAFKQLDATDVSNVDRLLDESVAFLGHVDLLVNNAAAITRTRFLDITLEQYSTVLDVNLRFPFFATQAFARHMKEHSIKGSIINVSSVSATRAVSQMAHYQCSKAGLHMLTRGAAYELGPDGIRVNTISPGLTATKANQNQWRDDPERWQHRGKDIPLGRTGIPTDHAGAAVFLASDESSWMTGGNLVIDGGAEVV
jgi:glucose 1-dehydrogenase/3-oxoacyl-[acyl-carrier protein] reductase